MLRARQMWAGQVAALPGLREALGLTEPVPTARPTPTVRWTRWRRPPARWSPRWSKEWRRGCRGRSADTWSRSVAATGEAVRRAMVAVLRFAATEIVPRLARTTDEITNVLHALDGGYVPAGPSGSPLRGLINVLPTGRNFYSVDPKAIPSALAWETGQAMADSLLERYRDRPRRLAPLGRPVGLGDQRDAHRRATTSPRSSRCIGVRPRLGPGLPPGHRPGADRPRTSSAGPASTSRSASPASSATRSRTWWPCSTTRSGWSPSSTSRTTTSASTRRRDAGASTATGGGPPCGSSAPGRARTAPGILPLIDSRNWRDDADLAEVYAVWGGYAYGRGLDGVPARAGHGERVPADRVAAKNIDTREHDIADSDDYFQYHGGMIATVRALTGTRARGVRRRLHQPGRGADPQPDRGDRADLPGPGGEPAVDRRDAPARLQGRLRARRHRRLPVRLRRHRRRGRPTGCTSSSPRPTCSTRRTRSSSTQSNPWALHGIAERLLEAADRTLWESPDPATLAALQEVYLATEGDLEEG